jgi:hypothetical protein
MTPLIRQFYCSPQSDLLPMGIPKVLIVNRFLSFSEYAQPNSVNDREYSRHELLVLLNGKLFFVLEFVLLDGVYMSLFQLALSHDR